MKFKHYWCSFFDLNKVSVKEICHFWPPFSPRSAFSTGFSKLWRIVNFRLLINSRIWHHLRLHLALFRRKLWVPPSIVSKILQWRPNTLTKQCWAPSALEIQIHFRKSRVQGSAHWLSAIKRYSRGLLTRVTFRCRLSFMAATIRFRAWPPAARLVGSRVQKWRHPIRVHLMI